MTRPRLIVCLLLKNGLIVRSQLFRTHQIIGTPISTVRRLSNWNVDELVLLDISEEDYHDMRRDDLQMHYKGTSTIDILRQVAEVSFMPLAFGGRIRSLDDMRTRLEAGADKCVINSQAVATPELIEQGAKQFGAQCIVVSIDAYRHEDGRLEAFTEGGTQPTGLDPADLAKKVERLGAGEIFLNSIDRDGTGAGYDVDLIQRVAAAVSIPVIACGGVGSYDHFPAAVLEGGASAAAAANIFHFFELAYPLAKKACLNAGIPMRSVSLDSAWFPREPVYDLAERDAEIADRLKRAKQGPGPEFSAKPKRTVRWCSRCLYPSVSAAPMEFDDEGICMGCRSAEKKVEIPAGEWERRKELLIDILEKNRCRDGNRHDCIIAVSGGKDSHFQTHYIKNVLGFNPLLVTYYGNNFSPAGQRNLLRMKETFGVDHLIYQPSVELLKKLNRLGFTIMGDMNWHNHIGICTVPMKLAVQHKIPIVIWGEHGYSDLSGQFSMTDFVEWTYRTRLEHYCRGYEWNYVVGLEGITKQDMWAYQYPTDQEIFDLGLRGIHLSNYVYWEANKHAKMVIDKYNFEVADEPFDRTYRTMSNLDDIHENGVHDYMKFIKLGYGRCTDHATKDVRAGVLSRGQAVDLVRKHDHVKPRDLTRWLEYTGMSEDEFDAIADTFRNPRVWRRENDAWVKDNLWDERNS
ncbi:MAG: N-acetyl sugar amidotransferase [Alphaproteobacteria bacterium]|nr:N-acetyl sugar amidotransferase [Alphaproteobacteria bacterium]